MGKTQRILTIDGALNEFFYHAENERLKIKECTYNEKKECFCVHFVDDRLGTLRISYRYIHDIFRYRWNALGDIEGVITLDDRGVKRHFYGFLSIKKLVDHIKNYQQKCDKQNKKGGAFWSRRYRVRRANL